MNQRKPNRKAWYSLALVMLLCVAILVAAGGTTFARYQRERQRQVDFQVRKPELLQLGMVQMLIEDGDPATETPVFIPVPQLEWKTEDGKTQLTFAVANGTSEFEFSDRNQRIQLRMLGTLGILMETGTPKLLLTLPPQEGSTEETVVEATVTPFVEGTSLHQAYGDGWLYTFLNEKEEELYWELPGGRLSYISFTVTIEGDVPENLNLLQPQVTAEVIQN